MVKRTLIFIAAVLVVPYLSFAAYGQLPSVYEVKKMPFNSDLFSDISPLIVKEGILFCSDKRFSVIKDRTAFDGHRLYNLYLAAGKDSTGWSAPAEIKSERNFLFNVGPSALAADGQTIYFTSEIETGKAAKKRKFKNHSGIFIARLSGRTIVSLQPFKYNNPEYNIGQPSVSSDGKYLFFASDMPGGQGGSDIYYCESVNGEWSGPKNLGPGVNTAGAENYPSIQSEGRLYFTSDRTGGYGKLDIYFTSMSDRKWDDPILLPEPINSTYDDFALKADDNLQKGYFTSNRDKSDDIYRFESAIIRKTTCPALLENSYCYRFSEENSAKLDTIPFRYDWRFGDGKEASGVIVEHCYKGPGTYIVQLNVINLITGAVSFNEKLDTLIVAKIEQPYISAPDSVKPGERIMLNADKTNLPGWNIVQYYWNFGDETIAVGEKTEKNYNKPGTYNIQLIVSTKPGKGGLVREACVSKNIIVMH